ncbi:4'-phosphopantetheinyl transferase superfamily protein [Actinocorallia sp. B10E7]|uniref:4'-phosphopantetheinyl transferase superfamily protein n=1 Tax=Actinocorallia sp. B10E7 TaxID=3153558 RepID=UPI00325E82BE
MAELNRLRLLAATWTGPSRAGLVFLGALLGEPALPALPHPRLSMSRSGDLNLAACVLGAPVTGFGIDLEEERSADPRTGRFFLRDHELRWLDGVRPRDRDHEHMRLWTVKEALFKADPANAGTVLRDYGLADPSARTGRAGPARYTTVRLGGRFLSFAVTTNPRSKVPPKIDFADVAERVATLLNVPADRLEPGTLVRDLVRESFMLVEMVIDLQEEFDAVFGQEQLREVSTLGDLAALLRETGREVPC